MKNRRYKSKRIKLVRHAYNFDSAKAFGFVFKLAYGFSREDKPELEIFVETEKSIAGEWATYGAKSEAAAFRLRFESPGREKVLETFPGLLRITSVAMGAADVKYPRTGVETAPFHAFDVTRDEQ
jgi:hypothetical protein